ncbi:MAG: HIT domain-containing protein [Candidatus Harrisonbacteria bacterium]|nr:HIT domain-containing protein [Candidatus Harrisonbacteria bacterium]
MSKSKSQLRQDLVSGDWIVIAPGRAKRPYAIIKKTEPRIGTPKRNCPFEDLQKTGQGRPILSYGNNNDWQLQVIENKYPAFVHQDVCSVISKNGPFSVSGADGHHDLVITRAHDKTLADLTLNEAQQVFESFRDRYLMLLNDPCVAYISIFFNWGLKAGASVYHPHYQIVAIPVVPPDVQHSLNGSGRYFGENKQCVHCVMMDWELRHRKRVIYQNEGAAVFVPFVSKEPFEFRVFPKKHLPYFENTLDVDLDYVVEALQKSLKKMKKNLKDPDYNFFIHTAPIRDKEKYNHYHWHLEVIPKVTIRAGFELGTGVTINVVDPDEAADLLRK